MKLLSTGLAAVFLLGGASAHAEEIALNPGQWSFTQEGAVTVMGNTVPMPPENNLECITEEDAAFNPDEFRQDGCDITAISETSTRHEYAMVCESPEMSMSGDLVIELGDGGNSASITSNMSGQGAGMGEMTAVLLISAERVGECAQ